MKRTVGSLKIKPDLRRYLRRTNGGLLRIDTAATKPHELRDHGIDLRNMLWTAVRSFG